MQAYTQIVWKIGRQTGRYGYINRQKMKILPVNDLGHHTWFLVAQGTYTSTETCTQGTHTSTGTFIQGTDTSTEICTQGTYNCTETCTQGTYTSTEICTQGTDTST